MGFDANMTLGHTKGVDILVSDPKSNKMFKLEVKTRYNQPLINSTFFGRNLEWHMSSKNEIADKNLFYCFVDIAKDTNFFRFFIVSSGIVARYVKERHYTYLNAHPKVKNTDLRFFRLAVDDVLVSFPKLMAEKFENNWSFNQ